MIEEIEQIISDNTEEKHFLEYGKGVFATQDAVNEIAESLIKLRGEFETQENTEVYFLIKWS